MSVIGLDIIFSTKTSEEKQNFSPFWGLTFYRAKTDTKINS